MSTDASKGADAPRSDSIGDRFNQRWAADQLDVAFAAAGHPPDAPRSIGVLEVGLLDGRPVTALLDELGPDLVLRIRQTLPRDARLVFAHGARFIMALPGDPLLEALLIVDRVRDALEREDWQIDGMEIGLVFDAGVATRRDADESLAVTLEAAERSLQQARTLSVRRHDAASPHHADDTEAAARPSALPPGWSRSHTR